MTNKKYALIGFLAPTIFWTTYFIMANQRIEYSFLTKAISELGSMDAPNKWIWNFLGYIIPGLLITVFSVGLYRSIARDNGSKLPLYGIFLSGIFMAVSGLFPGDFENRQSTTMLFHTVGSIGSYLFFLVGAFSYPKPMKKTDHWKSVLPWLLLLTWLSILFGIWPFVFTKYPAVGQRIIFLLYFSWITIAAYSLYRKPDTKYEAV